MPTPTPDVLLLGTGPMAVEYAKVLRAHRKRFLVVGRGRSSALNFQNETGVTPIVGGLQAWLRTRPILPKKAIIAVSETELGKAAIRLVKSGVRSILVEKPGGFTPKEIARVARVARSKGAQIYVGYNRRFYASVNKVRSMIRQDGGLHSFNFEFTEWSHVIAKLPKAPATKAHWFLHNSTHVIDLAFFIGGWPKRMTAYTAGRLPWHPRAAIFSGAGVSTTGALFSYQANWQAPGRWGLEFLTGKHRFILRPIEKLQVQKRGSVQISELPLNDDLDVRYKPGLYRQVRAFFSEPSRLLTMSEQVHHLTTYEKFFQRP